MGKSLKKYKKPPRGAREPIEEAPAPPEQRQAMRALGIPLQAVTKPRLPPGPKHETSADISEDRVDSGNEGVGLEFELPSAAIPPKKRVTKAAASVACIDEDAASESAPPASPTPVPSTRGVKKRAAKAAGRVASIIEEPVVGDVAPVIPEATLKFMARWLPRWHGYCSRFPQPEDFAGVAPYCSAGMDLVLAFTHDVTASHISKKGLPFDISTPNASPWEVRFTNVFYPADKIRNFIDINVRRFEKFRDGEEMEGMMWVDMNVKYREAVGMLLDKMDRFKELGIWEKESRRVNEMVRYGVFGKVVEEASKDDEQNYSEV